MSYEVQTGASPARRARRRRALITLGVVALLLFFAFWYAYSYIRDSDKAAVPSPTCTATSTALTPASVTVNVYNATERAGLAAKTASDVRKRGFTISTIANDPLQKPVAGIAEVRYGASGEAGSKLVLALVKGARAVKDARTDASVDLVLGTKFTALVPAPQTPATTPPKGC